MESDNQLVELLLKETISKNEEIIKLDNLINTFKSEDQYSNPIYSTIFIQLVETRLELIKEV